MSAPMRFVRAARPLTKTTQTARFSAVARRAAGGDAGAPRSGGSAQGDAFTKREEASENYYVRQHEKEKIEALRAKIRQGEADLKKDNEALNALNKEKK
ncbi:mitochondrial ATPase inhibitor, IATP-domain-containing protein [Delphinella strobiligena]|nr:mitochondrial ATPase inhibitor, IATP-domain-containing protein [Delphinella strobiligena]